MKFKLHPKTPLPMVLGVILNLLLVIALEVLLVYRYPVPLTTAELAQVDPNFENYTVVPDDPINGAQFLRVRRSDGRQYIVPTRTHPIFFNRARVYHKEIKEVDDRTGTQAFRLGLRVYQVTAHPDYLLVQSNGNVSTQQTALTYYLCLSGLLTLAELWILEKIRGE